MNNNLRKYNRTAAIVLIRFSPVFGAIAGLIVGAIFVILWGENPWLFIEELFKGAFGSPSKIGATLNRTTPLLLAGLGTAIAWRSGAINIGQEGQLFMGGLGAAVVAFWVGGLPQAVGLPLTLIGGALFGMLLAGISAAFRLYNGVHEILTSLLLNFIGVLFVSFMIATVINDPITSGNPQTPIFPESAWLPIWRKLGSTHAGILIGVILTLIGSYIMWRTPIGFKLRMGGSSQKATRAAGYSPNKLFFLAMIISGGLSGLAGATEVTGSIYHRLVYAFGVNLGFDSLAVALLANINPIAVLPSALFFGALRAGTLSMQRAIGVPAVLLQIVQGSIMLFIVIGFALGKSKRLQKLIRSAEFDKLDTKVEEE
jgi:general nucleoside transport system permease protein